MAREVIHKSFRSDLLTAREALAALDVLCAEHAPPADFQAFCAALFMYKLYRP